MNSDIFNFSNKKNLKKKIKVYFFLEFQISNKVQRSKFLTSKKKTSFGKLKLSKVGTISFDQFTLFY